jgi:coproporphyrinogen III oxidase
MKEEWIKYIHDLQDRICTALEKADGKSTFREDAWERPGGGGGKTKVITHGNIFEKGGVNTSVVFGEVSEKMKKNLGLSGHAWFACGLSLVLHPYNPYIPTVHANYRMFELYDEAGNLADRWFGGGTDLTPYYLFEEDAIHFHGVYKNVCDAFDPEYYPLMKKHCDDYFINTHRGDERRGIGGIFYDHRRAVGKKDDAHWFALAKACGDAFTNAYLPIVEKRKDHVFHEKEKYWQEIRRGRYVEFNLVHDRGTLFGLRTHGRTESILMSLPPTVRFDYDYHPAMGSEEAKLVEVCLNPREWANFKKEKKES